MDFNELDGSVKESLEKDDIETALKLLSAYFKKDKKDKRIDAVINFSAIYHSLEKDKIGGDISNPDFRTALNNIRSQILAFMRTVDEENTARHELMPKDEKNMDGSIPVFFSVGSPHNQSQVDYIETLKNYLAKYKVKLITLEGDEWSDQDPLNPIRKKMLGCYGCLVLALERIFVKDGISKRGSTTEHPIHEQNYSTPWSHIEAAMAYQLDLPFLILKDKSVKGEGMLDDILFEWRIVQIDPATPGELDAYPIKSFIRNWVEEIKRGKAKRMEE